MKVVSLNVYNFKKLRRIRGGVCRLTLAILKENPDIVFLQEAYNYIPVGLSRAFIYRLHFWEKGLSILSKYPITKQKFISFNEDKGLVYARIGSDDFVNVHLDHQVEETRIRQIRRIMTFVRSLPATHCGQILIGGDFNMLNKNEYTAAKWKQMLEQEAEHTDPESLAYQIMTESFYDTYNGPKNPVTSEYGRRVDYFFSNHKPNGSFKIIEDFDLSDHAMISYKISQRTIPLTKL